jgi:hypothetical protein
MDRFRTVLLTAVVTAALVSVFAGPGAIATHQPADKVIATGSGIEAFRVGSASEAQEEPTVDRQVIMTSRLRSSSPSDLVIGVNLECALWTATSTASEELSEEIDSSETRAQVKVWVTIDGGNDPDTGVIPVASDDAADTGKVVFCDRAHRMDVQFFDTDGEDDTDDQLMIQEYLRTRTSNSFEWITLNVGNGVHTIEVWAELQAQVTRYDAPFGEHSDGTVEPAAAAIGKRTMVIEPGKFANDATI